MLRLKSSVLAAGVDKKFLYALWGEHLKVKSAETEPSPV